MYRHGDLLFTQLGSDQNAISAVTEGYKGARVNHMGVVVKNNLGWFVLEAFPPEVRVTQIDVFLRRSAHPATQEQRYIAARLAHTWQPLVPPAVQFGLARRDVPYDDLYLTDPSRLYCSELVVDMFRDANHGVDFFVEKPMSFRDPVTHEVLPAWKEYYAHFGMEVPDGQPGSNPGDISRDSRLEVYEVQGPLTGYDPNA
jgi:hypothetical protein